MRTSLESQRSSHFVLTLIEILVSALCRCVAAVAVSGSVTHFAKIDGERGIPENCDLNQTWSSRRSEPHVVSTCWCCTTGCCTIVTFSPITWIPEKEWKSEPHPASSTEIRPYSIKEPLLTIITNPWCFSSLLEVLYYNHKQRTTRTLKMHSQGLTAMSHGDLP